ncbi:ferritin-like domain-containing protein [Ephemerocybe angulata]|uniref:Ferritin-like domain-containing protein n=1 Tax=Ephemerocybe angulata TaxID=980116 RepID=A0A8H6I1P8_9AGAR|nr:ferritin-like domain-containing protein [Tulosesus angulatus]
MRLLSLCLCLGFLLPIGALAATLPPISQRGLKTSRAVLNATDDYNGRLLTFALSLEEFALAFYNSSLSQFSPGHFNSDGYAAHVRRGYERIQATTQAHVDYLTSELTSLGDLDALGSCDYGFPINSTRQFIDMSEAIHALAVSTYTGTLQHIHTSKYKRAFGSMLGLEARYATWISTTVKNQDLWNSPFESPLTLNDTWTVAGLYVTSCPPGTNPTEIFPQNLVDWPVLTIPHTVNPGDSISLSFNDTLHTVTPGKPLHAAFLVGSGAITAPLTTGINGYSVTVPQSLGGRGAVWVKVIQGGSLEITDSNMVAGPALMIMPSQDRTGNHVKTLDNTWSW